MPRRTIRLPEALDKRIGSAAKLRGYSSPSAFLRAAIKREVSEQAEGTGPGTEQIIGSLKDLQHSIRRLERAQQALFALVDSLAKVVVTCVPEPRGAALELALGEARNRRTRLLATAGHAMLSDSLIAMEDLMKGEEKGISRGEKA
jgi:Arc/MetJ-type ribon-helix-helix transcriptional regulator